MQFTLVFLCIMAFGVNAVEVTPTSKVVALLQGMLEHGKGAKHAEQVVYANKETFCSDQKTFKQVIIIDEKDKIGGLSAQISKDTADVGQLSRQVASLDADENTWSSDIQAARAVRLIEHTDYETTHGDYTKAIDATGRAVAVLKKQTHDRTQAASFAQLSSSLQELSLIPDSAKRAIDAFVQTGGEDVSEAYAAPEANGYEFQANGVIDMLEKLQSKFIDEKTLLEKEEANSKSATAQFTTGLLAEIGQAETTESRKNVEKGNTIHVKAVETSDRSDEVALLGIDEKFLKDLTSDCAMEASDFAARQTLRTEEIEAIQKAIEILSGDIVTGGAAHLPSLLQKKTSSSLSQLRFTANSQLQVRVSQFLHERAQKFNSLVLEKVAGRASSDPFSKVKKMIKDLVVRLMEEANEESDHKGWCDTELGTNEQTRKEKSSSVQTLTADIETLEASIAKIAGEVEKLTAEVSALVSAMSDATTLRTADKATNAATVSDAQDAQTAVEQAVTVLKEFYAKAAEATSFAQTVAPYNGMAAEHGGVVGMLEVIEADFARLESETKAAEATAQKTHDDFITLSKTSKASKDTAIEHKNGKSQDATQALGEKNTDLEGTQKELTAALTYYDKLKPSCVNSGSTYEDRVARRKEEVESLQEALKVMNGEDIAEM